MSDPDVIVKKYNRGYNIQFNITDSDGTAKNVSGYTVTFKVWDKYSGTIISSNCSITSSVGGQCTYSIVSGVFSLPKKYLGELEMTKGTELRDTKTFVILVEDTAP